MTIEQQAGLVTIIAAICTGTVFLIKEIRFQRKKYRKKFSRIWTNEGDVMRIGKETHYLDLDISVDEEDGEVLGILKCRSLKIDEYEFNSISVNGTVNFRKAIINLTHFSHGRLASYGKVKLKLKGKLLHWKLIKGDSEMFPKKIVMWSNSNADFARVPEI